MNETGPAPAAGAPPELPADLLELARLHGVQPTYTDAFGTRRRAGPEAVVALLRALGEPVERPGEAALAARERAMARARRPLEPVAVAWEGRPAAADLVLPAAAGGAGQVECRLELEEGRARVWKRRLDRLETVGRRTAGADELVVRRLSLPSPLPLGYHRLRVAVGGAEHVATVISAPYRAWAGDPAARDWGVFLPLYALRTERSLGLADLSDLEALGDWAAGLGSRMVGTLPILAAFLDEPFDPSPYAPASRLFWNELYVDPRRLPELERAPAARRLLASEDFRAEVAAAAADRWVDYRRSAALLRRLLEPLAAAFFERRTPESRTAGFEAFRAAHPRLDDYAAFRAVGERRKEPWQEWPEPLRGGRIEPADYDETARRYHLYAQFAAAEQVAAVGEALAAGGPGLYLDLPLGVHPSGYDVWRDRDQFVGGVAAGAPPDLLFTQGQDWGFHPLHPERQREAGYRYLADSLAHHLEHAGMLRIDHVMQLHRIFCVPRGMKATEGLYLEYPAEELYAVVCLESHRARARIVGENLGTVPGYVNAALADHGISGMTILQLELLGAAATPGDPAAPLEPPVPEGAVAALNTHDMPTFAAWYEGADIDDRLASGLLDRAAAEADAAGRARLRTALERRLRDAGRLRGRGARAVAEAELERLGESDSPAVLVNLEDLWEEPEPQNVPGTLTVGPGSRPNWRRLSRRTLEQMAADPDVVAALERLDSARRRAAETAAARASTRPPEPPEPTPPSPISDDDVYLFNEGRHFRLWEKLGAHPAIVDGVAGCWFAVWAPDAERVSVAGDFNGWDHDRRPLGLRGRSGIWEGFVPGVERGQRYKFHVTSRHGGFAVDKADPFAVRAETPPATASVVWDLDYRWDDAEWMAHRAPRNARDAPISIYEVHLGSWRRVPEEGDRSLTYRELGEALAEHAGRHGFTHVELLPVMEHPFYGSWGYQTTGYFAPTSRYGTPQDLMAMIDRLHRAGIGVILDWVPSHFPTDEHGPGFFDGTHLYEHADPRSGFHPDWNSFIFNYGRHEVRSFLISSALYWLELFHADGIRVDAVASMLYRDYSRRPGEWIPNLHGGRENLEAIELLRQLGDEIHRAVPGTATFAEESTAWPGVTRPTWVGGLGFDFKWDMGWMHDTLRYLGRDPIHRKFHHDELTFRMIYAFSECYCLPLSHDEVVHGKRSLLAKMPGDDWQKRAGLRLLLGYQWAQPGKKLLFMGAELGQWREWDHDSSLDWHLLDDPAHAALGRWVADLNRVYRERPALHRLDCDPEGFSWLDPNDSEQSVIGLVRRGGEGTEPLVAVFNFTPVPRHGYRIGAPAPGRWVELLNSDATDYGGSGAGNLGGVEAVAEPLHGQPWSMALTLPPLGMLLLAPAGGGTR